MQHHPSRLSGEGSLTREREALLASGSGVHATSEGEAPRVWWSLTVLSPWLLCCPLLVDGRAVCLSWQTAGAVMGILMG